MRLPRGLIFQWHIYVNDLSLVNFRRHYSSQKGAVSYGIFYGFT